jgi:pyridoxine 5'-phosphate synthase PdxJ
LKSIGVDRVELYTEAFANVAPALQFGIKPADLTTLGASIQDSERDQFLRRDEKDRELASVLKNYRRAADQASAQGLGVNAGHDLNLQNLKLLIDAVPAISEVSIGHALVIESLYLGFQETLKRYLAILN